MTDFEGRIERFCQRALDEGDTVVDVGAHLGRHTVPFARRVGPTGRVIAFEPLPAIGAQLQDHLAALAATDAALAPIEVHSVALGTASSEADFVSVVELPEYSGFRRRVYDSEVVTERIRVRVEPLDSFLVDVDRVDLLKVDTEGGEYDVLRGASDTLARHRPVVVFECGDNSLVEYEHTAGDLFDLLAGHGYLVEDIERRPLDRAAFVESSRVQQVWDYVAYPSECDRPQEAAIDDATDAARSIVARARRMVARSAAGPVLRGLRRRFR